MQRPVPSQSGLTRVHTSSDLPVSTTGASAAAWSMPSSPQRCGDGKFSGSDVTVRACVRPRPSWSTRARCSFSRVMGTKRKAKHRRVAPQSAQPQARGPWISCNRLTPGRAVTGIDRVSRLYIRERARNKNRTNTIKLRPTRLTKRRPALHSHTPIKSQSSATFHVSPLNPVSVSR